MPNWWASSPGWIGNLITTSVTEAPQGQEYTSLWQRLSPALRSESSDNCAPQHFVNALLILTARLRNQAAVRETPLVGNGTAHPDRTGDLQSHNLAL